MIKIRYDSVKLSTALNNTTLYSQGFLDGIGLEKLQFNRVLGGFTAEALGNFIDARARANPESLHHVYEWNRAGDESSRLFRFNVNAQNNMITFTGVFLPSKSVSENSDRPFENKAEIMENGISIVVEPKLSPMLVFEDNGQTVFTTNSVFIDHPGGDEVANSFGTAVSDFFDYYFVGSILKPLMSKLSSAPEFSANYSQGIRSGRPPGVAAGRKYFKLSGVGSI